ncbi:MAG: hypothetical protein RRC07_17465, partial [Anaerolineae bacterium]|nr:hypothetical protein [Anaerolineae bacterium]
MEILLGSYQGVLTEALTVGVLVGVAAGIILFTVDDAGDRFRLIVVGVLGGAFLMLIYQALALGDVVAWRTRGFNREFEQAVYTQGPAFWHAVLRIIQAGIGGGILMFIFLAPARALRGALLGLLMGVSAAFVVWGALRLLEAPNLPLVLFGALVAGLV